MNRFHTILLATLVSASAPGLGCSGGGDGKLPPIEYGNDGVDEDGDGISNVQEGAPSVDTDGDGTPDYQDTDSDDDGVDDALEAGDEDLLTAPVDSDGDGTPNFRDTDSDGNGLYDGVEGAGDLDEDGTPDFADKDDDGDGLFDHLELGDEAGAPRDTDGDGTPDYRDTDSDGDGIPDSVEGMSDLDGDGLMASIDDDADGDCIPDAREARDSDGDGRWDNLSIDSDRDGVPDAAEDLNCNGALDEGETDATTADSDGDGVSDLVESVAGTNPRDATSNPQANGDFFFVMPYEEPAWPRKDTLDFATDIVQADVFFLMDTTGSMGGEISNLKTSVATIINDVSAAIPNTAFGVGGYDDFPTNPYGSAGDLPFYLRHRVMSVLAGGLASVRNAVNMLTTHNGADGPESGWEGIYQVATGAGVSAGNAVVVPFDPANSVPAMTPDGESVGDIGGAGFRKGSLPIIVMMTDAHNHNSEGFPGDAYAGTLGTAAATRASAIAAMQAIGARMIGVISNDWDYANAKADATAGVVGTGARVSPDAWGAVGAGRPAGCALTKCCTGAGGAGENPVAGLCPLTFTIDSSGSGLGAAIVRAIEVLTRFVRIDIDAVMTDTTTDAVDAVAAFVESVVANPAAGGACAAGLTAIDTNSDALLDTFDQVNPGSMVCFDVNVKDNVTVPGGKTPQVYTAQVTVRGDGVTDLATRTVYFLVPPTIEELKID